MAQVSARHALEYAIGPPTLRLLGVVLLGWVLLPVGLSLLVSGPFGHFRGVFTLLSLVGLAITLVGLLALYGGLVAPLYKAVVDAVGDA